MSYKIGLLSLFVRDVAQSTRFYTDVLDFRLQAEFSNEEFAMGTLADGPAIALRSCNQLPAGTPPTPGGVEVNFEVEDIQSAWQDWKAKNVAGLTEITDMGAGLNFSARDPDGHALNVYHLHDFMGNA
jgi:catechol 2,3-dioxygenase-like lactoylglutathione lyase family enzyme